MANIFEVVAKFGSDQEFTPMASGGFAPTKAAAGTSEKLEILADRLRRGMPLWHTDDRADYDGLTGGVRPRH